MFWHDSLADIWTDKTWTIAAASNNTMIIWRKGTEYDKYYNYL